MPYSPPVWDNNLQIHQPCTKFCMFLPAMFKLITLPETHPKACPKSLPAHPGVQCGGEGGKGQRETSRNAQNTNMTS